MKIDQLGQYYIVKIDYEEPWYIIHVGFKTKGWEAYMSLYREFFFNPANT